MHVFGILAAAFVMQFHTPSGNIGCAYSADPSFGGPSLRCDILSGLKPKPKRACSLDLTGFSLRPTGRAGVVCAGDTAVDRRSPLLGYGKRWSRGGFTCTSSKAGLRCRNRSAHGFFLSRTRSYRF